MTNGGFINVLNAKGYSYEIEGDKIIVTHRGDVYLSTLISIPPVVEFRNVGDVYLNSLISIPPGTEFENEGDVDLRILIGRWINRWDGNIEGIVGNRLFNLMISKGIFER